jgi:hypothetical protein
MGEGEYKNLLGRRLWLGYAGVLKRFDALVEVKDWKECRLLLVKMVVGFSSQADNSEIDDMLKAIDHWSGKFQRQSNVPGMHRATTQDCPTCGYVHREIGEWYDGEGNLINPKTYDVTYASPIFREWFWRLMNLIVVRYVASLFDATIRGSFTASILESETEKRMPRMPIGHATIGDDYVESVVQLNHMMALAQAAGEA